MEKITDLDYFFTKDGIAYITRGYYHPAEGIFACPVFWPDKNGDRLHPQRGRYRKDIAEFNEKIFSLHPEYHHNLVPHNFPLVPRRDIVEVFHPRDKMQQFLKEEKETIWHNIVFYLANNMSTSPEDIGVFGSYLVDLNKDTEGRHIKDVDFAIYGIKNFLAVKSGMEKLLKYFGFSHISKDHVCYHAEKFGRQFSSSANTFEKTLINKWSSIQIAPGLLNTLRFVYKENEIPPNPIKSGVKEICRIAGDVINDFGSNFMPRVFSMQSDKVEYTVVTYCWSFQSCVKKGDYVEITGNLHDDRRTISIDAFNHGIKIL